ncbi:MAG: tail fiber domain-containing protein [Bdellovibrionales bacterium]|nr:tail fiber domain-containing protein [Bdellovibrionales bacterium]
MDSTGNVGVGTTNPQSRLDVSGTIRATEICDENGSNCKDISSGWGAGGDIDGVTTAAGSGLTGGTASGTATISVVTDGTTVEVNGSNQIQVRDGGITAAKIASNAVTTAKILDANVTTAKIADANVTSVKLAADSVTSAKILDGTIAAADLASDSVTSAKIVDGTIATADIGNGSVTDAKIDTVMVNKITSALGQYFTYAPNGGACAAGEVLKMNASSQWVCGTDTGGVTDHGALSGLADDDHTQYVMLAGRSGGQSIIGGTAASNSLTLDSTSSVTKGNIVLQPNGGNVGIGTTNPGAPLDISNTRGDNVYLRNPAAGDPWNYIGFYNNTNRRWWAGADNSGNFAITRDNAAGNILLNGGNVGIGTTNPSRPLHLASSTSATMILENTAAASNLKKRYINTGSFGAGSMTFGKFSDDMSSSAEHMTIDTSGNVGIGTTAPTTRLDVEGTIQIGDGGETCSVAANAGMVKYSSGTLQYCNGSSWQTLGVSGSGLTTLNGQTGSTQTFAVTATGLAPAINSASNVHTLSIPLASGAGVTSGTISKTEYDSFVAKLSAVSGSTLSAGMIWVGNGSNAATAVAMSGDATLSNTGALTIANNAITNVKISADAVTSAKIQDGTIALADLATNSVDSTKIVDGAVAAVDLAADSVTSAKIVDGTIATADLANGAVTDAKIDTVMVNKITSALGQYFTYAPNGGACAPGEVLKMNASSQWVCGTDTGGVTDHGALSGLADDDHTQYVMLAGRSGGQNLRGGTAASNNLTLESTSNATKGYVLLQPNGGNVGIGTTSPVRRLSVQGTSIANGSYRTISVNEPGAGNESISLGYDANGSIHTAGFLRSNNNLPLSLGTLVTPNAVTVLDGGNVGIGTTSPNAPLEINREVSQTNISLVNRTNSALDGGGVVVYRSRGTNSSPSHLLSGDRVGYFSFSNALTTSSWSSMESYTTQNHTGSAQGMDLRFSVVQNGTTGSQERMRIDQNGNVGIGTTSPTQTLDVNGPAVVRGQLSVLGGSTSANASLIINNSANTLSQLYVRGDGNVGIGTAIPTAKLEVRGGQVFVRNPSGTAGAFYSDGGSGFGIHGESNANYGVSGKTTHITYGGVVGYAQNGTNYGIIGHANQYAIYGAGDGYISGTMSWGSDARLKDNIQLIPDGLEFVMKLRPVSYTWKPDSDQAQLQKGPKHGFIAQEVQKILPGAVKENTPPVMPGQTKKSLNQKLGKFLTVEYNEFIAYMAKAIQELYAKFKAFESKTDKRLEALEKQNQLLVQQLELMKKQNEETQKQLKELRNKSDRIPASTTLKSK